MIPDHRRLSLPLIALVLVNLLPLGGVLWLAWDVSSIVILYWLENLVLGLYTIVKMLHLKGLGALFHAAFFCLHYGAFCGAHGLFILALTSGNDGGGNLFPSGEDSWPAHLVFIQMLVRAVQQTLDIAPQGVIVAWVGLFISHGVSLVIHYFGEGEYREATLGKLMQAPYKRIVILHVAIIAGGWAVMALGSPLGLLVVLILAKITLDIRLHRREHRAAIEAARESP